jgi:hypothetical protein
MSEIPGHLLPTYSDASRDDALFHYTTANGLIGIFHTGEIWGTAYYCANDESELAAGKGVLAPLFRSTTYKMIEAGDSRVETFRKRGVDIREHADQFEQQIAAMALSSLCAYITCFCKPASEEDFQHGLLSQWRGYGSDGGYALHFSRKKLLAAIGSANKADELNYELQDVHYAVENPMKAEVLSHTDAFVRAYMDFLDELAKPLNFNTKTMRSPIAGLPGGPLEAFLDYLIHTKNKHFGEERECRLSLMQLVSASAGGLPVHYFNRGGLLVPFTKTPLSSFNILDCVEWIVIGPGPRMGARFKSVSQLVRLSGREIKVRASHIPFTRL